MKRTLPIADESHLNEAGEALVAETVAATASDMHVMETR
jgi:hypothetical protein